MAQSIVAYVDKTLDEAKLGPLHYRVLWLVSFAYFFDVIDFTITGALIPNILQSKFFTDATPIPSAALFGLFVGALGQGEFTDRYGRKVVLQLGILIYSIATIGAALAPTPTLFLIGRFIAGIGLGTTQPLCFAYAAEFAPKINRGRTTAFMQLIGGACVWPIGTLFALYFLPVIDWRGIWVVIGIGGLVVLLFTVGLPESPRWLVTHGQGRGALDLLVRMGLRSPGEKEDFLTDAIADIRSDPMGVVFRQYRGRIIASMICFVAFFTAALGLGAWLPNLLATRGYGIPKALTVVLGMQLAFPLSSLFMMYALESIGRVKTAASAFVLATVFAIVFYYSSSVTMVIIIGFCVTFFSQLAGNSMQIFTSEVFPTNARASGFGIAQAGGRFGSAISVYVIGFLASFGLGYVMTGIAILLLIGAVAVTFISRETKGLALDTIAPPTA